VAAASDGLPRKFLASRPLCESTPVSHQPARTRHPRRTFQAPSRAPGRNPPPLDRIRYLACAPAETHAPYGRGASSAQSREVLSSTAGRSPAVRASMVTASRTRPRMHVASLRSIWLSLLHPFASRCLRPRVPSISLAYLEDPFYRAFLKRSGTFSRHLLIAPLFRPRTLTMLLTTIGGCPSLGFGRD
jgi:hypothetical protein